MSAKDILDEIRLHSAISMSNPKGLTPEEIDGVKIMIDKRKLFLGQLVLDNFHLFDPKSRHILGSEFWKHYRQRIESVVDMTKNLKLKENKE